MATAVAQHADVEIITHAFLEAGRELGMTLGQLASVIGVSPSAMKNYSRGSANISSPKTQELSLGLIRVYRALFAILGGDREQMHHWMRTPNQHLNGRQPLELAANYQGLAELNVYLDAMRGRL